MVMTVRKLTLAEVFEIAIKIEVGAVQVYAVTAEKNPNPAIQKMAKILVSQEERHREVFNSWLQDEKKLISNEDKKLVHYSADEILKQLLPDLKQKVDSLLVKESAFLAKAEQVIDPIEFVNLGIVMEELTIQFYTKVMPFVEREKRGAVEKVLDEERAHLKIFLNLKQKLGALNR